MHTVYKICLDLQEAVSAVLLPIPQRDTARSIQIRLTQGGIPHPIPEDAMAVLTAKAPSGSSLPWLPCENRGDSLVCPIPGSHTALPGLLRCQLRLYSAADESLLLTAPEFTLEITEQVCDATDDGTAAPAPNALDTLVSNTLAAAEAATAIADRLAADAENGRFTGEKGEKGDTPVRGVDYFTAEDVADIQNALLSRLDFAVITEEAATDAGLLCLPDTAGLPMTVTVESPCTLTVQGKNFFDRSRLRGALLGEDTVVNITGGGFHYDLYTGDTGVSHAVDTGKLSLLPVLPAGTYTLSYRRLTDSGYLRVEQVAEDGTVTLLNAAENPVFTLETASRITLRRSVNTAMSVADVQIEPGTGATDYEAYRPGTAHTLAAGTHTVAALCPTTVLTADPACTLTAGYSAHTKNYIRKMLKA